MMAAKHFLVLVVSLVALLLLASPCSQILESAICMTLSGRAASAKLCRLKPSPNISSVGLLPANISIKVTPRLYTSPYVDTQALLHILEQRIQ
uniref:Uncharacterized protein n=1 Tax=Arundo donax TaxID=35708 RepID=A0A0A9HHI5_ARUDO